MTHNEAVFPIIIHVIHGDDFYSNFLMLNVIDRDAFLLPRN